MDSVKGRFYHNTVFVAVEKVYGKGKARAWIMVSDEKNGSY